MEGNVAMVYGAFGGIGRVLVEHMLAKRMKVMCCDIEQGQEFLDKWTATFGQGVVGYTKCDVRNTQDVNNSFASCSSCFDKAPFLVVNSAGILDEMDWENCVQINLNGNIRIVNATVEHIGKHKGGEGGKLVLISSVVGVDKGANIPVYTATKHGIVGLARSWADPLHHGDHGVDIVCLCPSGVNTVLLDYSLKKMHKPEVLEGFLKQMGGQEAFQSASDVASVIMDLAEDPSNNGKIYVLTKTLGTQEFEYQSQPFL